MEKVRSLVDEFFKNLNDIIIYLNNICRILGIIVIVLGLYSVLWGKSKDEPSNSFSDTDNELPLSKLMQIYMDAKDA